MSVLLVIGALLMGNAFYVYNKDFYNNENKKDGNWTYWNENAQITSESYWKDGECISGC